MGIVVGRNVIDFKIVVPDNINHVYSKRTVKEVFGTIFEDT